jgi:hypothetical protein
MVCAMPLIMPPIAVDYQLFAAMQQVFVRRTHGIVNAREWQMVHARVRFT